MKRIILVILKILVGLLAFLIIAIGLLLILARCHPELIQQFFEEEPEYISFSALPHDRDSMKADFDATACENLGTATSPCYLNIHSDFTPDKTYTTNTYFIWKGGCFKNIQNSQSYLSCPDDHHPHLIDLGLPSGTKWACCNVGSLSPESYGNYYSWGETEVKSVYNDVTYKYNTGVDTDGDGWYDKDIKYEWLGTWISGTNYDVAHVEWGENWKIPTSPQCDELIKNCTYEWTSNNGIVGGLFTGKNGASIFLPASGTRIGSELQNRGNLGYYWLGACILPGGIQLRFIFNNSKATNSISGGNPPAGGVIRPVSK